MGKIKDNLYYYFAEKNWGVRREYGPYVDEHREEHNNKRWKHWIMLIHLNIHYRIFRKKDWLYENREITKKWKNCLCDSGSLFFETGINQEKDVADILSLNGFEDIRMHTDLNGIIRVVSGVYRV